MTLSRQIKTRERGFKTVNMFKCDECGEMNFEGSEFCFKCGKPFGELPDANKVLLGMWKCFGQSRHVGCCECAYATDDRRIVDTEDEINCLDLLDRDVAKLIPVTERDHVMFEKVGNYWGCGRCKSNGIGFAILRPPVMNYCPKCGSCLYIDGAAECPECKSTWTAEVGNNIWYCKACGKDWVEPD